MLTDQNRPSSFRPSRLWWLIGLVLLAISLVVQLPAHWLVQRFAPNLPYLQQISGNLWQGQANWQIMPRPMAPLAGTLSWQWQPWHLLTGKLGLAVHIQTGSTVLDGQTKLNQTSWQLNDITGKIAPETLQQLATWQFPDSPITIKTLTLGKQNQGFDTVNGDITWAGGELGYPSGGKIYRINMPSLQGKLSLDTAGNKINSPTPTASANGSVPTTPTPMTKGSRLHLAMTNLQGQRLGDLYLDNDTMLDVELTQRLLKNMPDYKGQGVDDSVVVSLRQPLGSMGK